MKERERDRDQLVKSKKQTKHSANQVKIIIYDNT